MALCGLNQPGAACVGPMNDFCTLVGCAGSIEERVGRGKYIPLQLQVQEEEYFHPKSTRKGAISMSCARTVELTDLDENGWNFRQQFIHYTLISSKISL